MRIGIDATALYGRYGGVEYSLWNLLFALKSQKQSSDFEFQVYVPHDGPTAKQTTAFPANWRWIRLPFRGEQKLQRILWQQLVFPSQLRQDGCDLLHAPTYVLPLLNSRLRKRVPSVLTVYDVIALDEPQFATRLNRAHYQAIMPCSLKHATRVIVPSQSVRKAVLRHAPAAKDKIRVVPLGLEPIFLQPPSTPQLDEVRALYKLPDEFLLFVGNFEPKKNLHAILKALEKIPEAPPLVVAGGARAWHSVPSTPRVRPIGYVTRQDLPALYAQCRAFVFPSLAEGFGLPVLEALACGAPVVTSAAVPLPQIEEVALICDARDPASIADQIRRALGDKTLRQQLIGAGREYSREFTWQRTAAATLDIYREVC